MVDGSLPVSEGHEIGHDVKRTLLQSDLGVRDVLVHIEPADEDRMARIKLYPDRR